MLGRVFSNQPLTQQSDTTDTLREAAEELTHHEQREDHDGDPELQQLLKESMTNLQDLKDGYKEINEDQFMSLVAQIKTSQEKVVFDTSEFQKHPMFRQEGVLDFGSGEGLI